MIWDIDPVAFSIFGFHVRWYGLVYLLGFWIALKYGFHLQKKILSHPLSKDKFESLTFGTFFTGIIGGRLGEFIFYYPETFLSNFLQIFKVWEGGMSIHGGIIGSFLYIMWFARKHNIAMLRITDIFALPLAITLILGRFANFINGELVGISTGTDWGVVFPHIDDQLRHPTQLYESAKNLILSGVIFFSFSKGAGKKVGMLTTLFLLGYGVMRFIIEFWKESTDVFLGLNTGQILCIFMIAGALWIVFRERWWSKKETSRQKIL